jgi:hypothetical protein
VTKPELEELVAQVFASYNQTLYEADKKVVLRAWWEILQSLEYKDAKKVFLQIAATSPFMPKPGDIWRGHINAHTKVPPQPTPQIAWATLMGAIKSMNSGIPFAGQLPEALVRTIALLGDTAYALHTNHDQQQFTKTYETIVTEMQKQIYEIPETGAQAQ